MGKFNDVKDRNNITDFDFLLAIFSASINILTLKLQLLNRKIWFQWGWSLWPRPRIEMVFEILKSCLSAYKKEKV